MVSELIYYCTVCGHEMLVPEYKEYKSEGRIVSKRKSREAICCGKKMLRIKR